MGKKVVVVMPAYNAEKTLESVVERTPKVYDEMLVVNDGSTDKTKEVAESLGLKVISHVKNRGYGGAQKTGFKKAMEDGADILLLLHSDGQYAPEKAPSMIEPIKNGEADVVLGSRVLGKNMLEGGMPFLRYVGNRFLTFLENIAFRAKITEYHTGYRAYSAEALKRIPFHLNSESFDFDSDILIQCLNKKMRIVEIPIPTHYGKESSSLNPFIYVPRILKIIISYVLHKMRIIRIEKYK